LRLPPSGTRLDSLEEGWWVELDNCGKEFAVIVYGQQANRDWQFKAARAAGAGVEVEDALLLVEVGHVGVAEEDGGELSGGWVEVKGVQVVEHVDVTALDEDYIGLRELTTRAFAVYVAANGGDGGDLLKLLEDGDLADVAEVKDAVDAGECGQNLGTEEAVGVA
jgi:hypothetical protein